MLEVVKDAYCFPSIGTQMSQTGNFEGSGDTEEPSNQDEGFTFANAHWFVFPIGMVLDEMLEDYCYESGGFDLAYMTETDSLWNDDVLSLAIHGESLAFANPIAQAICITDAIGANIGRPFNALFWCMGAYGSSYPMTGNVGSDLIIQSSNAIAGKLIYKLHRYFMAWDYNTNVCSSVVMPIWKKFHYRYQLAKPVKEASCHPIGQTGFLWSSAKNPPVGAGTPDNFLYMIFRKRTCCASN